MGLAYGVNAIITRDDGCVTLPTGTHYVGTEMFGGSNALASINYLGATDHSKA